MVLDLSAACYFSVVECLISPYPAKTKGRARLVCSAFTRLSTYILAIIHYLLGTFLFDRHHIDHGISRSIDESHRARMGLGICYVWTYNVSGQEISSWQIG